eukprot:14181221-Heterocapsa_arctica.AAC.1
MAIVCVTKGTHCKTFRQKYDLNHDKHDSNGFTEGRSWKTTREKEDLNHDQNDRDCFAKGKA